MASLPAVRSIPRNKRIRVFEWKIEQEPAEKAEAVCFAQRSLLSPVCKMRLLGFWKSTKLSQVCVRFWSPVFGVQYSARRGIVAERYGRGLLKTEN